MLNFHRASLLLFMLASLSHGDWPNWRGPSSTGVPELGDYPTQLSLDQNLLWQIDLPGPGSSTPIVIGDAIYVTCTADGNDTICSYTLSGGPRWTKTIGAAAEAKHRNATGANPSIAVRGDRHVAYFKSGNLACLTSDGEVLWETNLQDRYGEDNLWWDLGSSPVMTSTGVVVAVMQAESGYLVCFDLESGDELWKTDRRYERPRESDQSYTTPSVAMVDGAEQIITFGADHLTGHNAATGKLLWQSGGFNPEDQGMWRTIASQTVSDGVAVVPYGRADYLAATRLGGQGDITSENHLWRHTRIGADVPSPAIHEGVVYVLGDKGTVTSLDLKTGQERWQGKLPRSGSKYFASPVVTEGHLYAAREDGAVFVAELDEQLKVVAAVELEETTVATPVLTNGKVLVRTRTKLYCFGS